MTAYVGRISDSDSLSQQNSLHIDQSGNFYITGRESGLNNASYIAKFDNTGAFQWDKNIGDNGAGELEEGGFVAVDSNSNVYVAYTAPPSSGVAGFVLIKLNSSGTHQWSRNINLSGSAQTRVRGIVIDSSDNIYTTGTVANEGFLLKYDSSGTFQWHRRQQSQATANPECRSFDIYWNGSDLYISGSNNSYTQATGAITKDLHCIKYSTSGTLTTLGSLKYDTNRTQEINGDRITVDSSGNVFVLDSARDLIVKYNSSGTLQWNKTIGGATIVLEDIDCQGTDLYVLGTASSGGVTDSFLFKINSSDTLVWQRKLEHSTDSFDAKVITTDSNNIYIGGLQTDGSADLVFAKLPIDGTLVSFSNNYTYSSITTYSLSDAGFTTGDVPKNSNSIDPSADTTAKTVADITYTINVYRTQLGTANFATTASLSATTVSNPSIVYLGNEDYTWDQTVTWNNFSIVDSWRIEETLNSAFVLSATGIEVIFGSSALSAQANLSATGAINKVAQANLSSEFAQTTAAVRLPGGLANLTTEATVSVNGIVDIKAQANFTVSTDLVAQGRRLKLADIEIEDFADLDVQAEVLHNARSNLTAEFTQITRGGFLVTIDDPYDYTWDTIDPDTWEGFVRDEWGPEGWFAFDAITLLARGGSERNGQSNLNSEFALNALGQRLPTASADLTVSTDISATAERFLGGRSNLTSAFDLTVVGLEFDLAIADLSSSFTQIVKGGIIHQATADLQEALNFNLNAERIRTVTCAINVDSALFCQPSLIPSVILDDLIVTATLTSDSRRFVGGRADFDAFAATLTLGQRLPGGSADLSSEFGIEIFGGGVLNGRAGLEAFVANITDSRISNVRGQASLASEFHGVFDGDLRLLDSELIYMILSDTRRYELGSETRIYDLLKDTRQIDIDPETGLYRILSETRAIDITKSLVD